MIVILQELILSFTHGGIPGVELAGDPGDYVWGGNNFDAVITHLLSQMESSGPAPLSENEIDKIESVEVTQDQIDNRAQCSVCMDDFSLKEMVKQVNIVRLSFP